MKTYFPRCTFTLFNNIGTLSTLYSLCILGVHDEVNNRVDGRVRHGEPEKEQKYVLCVGLLHEVLQQ